VRPTLSSGKVRAVDTNLRGLHSFPPATTRRAKASHPWRENEWSPFAPVTSRL
jgi:hypothetical protein